MEEYNGKKRTNGKDACEISGADKSRVRKGW